MGTQIHVCWPLFHLPMSLLISWVADTLSCFWVARTEKVGGGAAAVKEKAYHRDLMVRELRACFGDRHTCREWEQRVPEDRWTSCQQEDPAPTARLREEKPAAKWDTWYLRNRPNRPHALLGAAGLIFDPIRWWNSHTYTAALGCLWLQV